MLESGSAGWVILIFAGAFLTSLILVKLYLYVAPLIGAIAKPTERGTHRKPTPTGGGIVLIIVLALALFVFGRFENFYAFLISASLISILGLVDDIRPLPLIPRLVLQTVFVIPAVFFYVSNNSAVFFSEPLSLVVVGITAVFLINVFNFMDGSDGMAALNGILIFGGLAVLGVFYGENSIAILPLALSGALLGFLVFNWHPANAFMGDAGSTLVGFAIAIAPFVLSENGHWPSSISIWVIISFSWIFVFDAVFTRLKRLLSKSRFWEPNRDHFYQRLIDSGTRQQTAAQFYAGMTLIMILTTLGAVIFGGLFFVLLIMAAIGTPLLLAFATGKKVIDLNT